MTAFLGSPRLLRGALIGVDPLNPLASVVVFQYNPGTTLWKFENDPKSPIYAARLGTAFKVGDA